MSTAGPLDSRSQPIEPTAFAVGAFPVPGASPPLAGAADPSLVQQTKNEIRALVQEINVLSRSDMAPEQYYEEFLRRVVAALAAHGGAVWEARESGVLEPQYQINLPSDVLVDDDVGRQRHSLLLKNVLLSGQATLVPPRSGSPGEAEAGNPTDFLLVLAALRVDQRPIGVVEVFQRPTGGPTTQRGYLRFLVQMSELADEFLKTRRLRHLGDRQTLWKSLERFVFETHRHLDSRTVAFTIVNEGRRLMSCDRVSLTLARGKLQRVVAVSGLDTLDRRSEEITLLGRLASAVAAAGKLLWHMGNAPELPPQIERHLQPYLDRSHAKSLAILPLRAPAASDAQPSSDADSRRPLGCLVVEQMTSDRAAEGLSERVDAVVRHSESALANALEHEDLFLLPLWRALGKSAWVVRARNLPKIVLVLAAFIGVGAALALIPADFDLAAQGKLQPRVRRDVYAHLDGVVVDVPVEHGQLVEPGQVLVRLSNNSLDVEKSNLVGRQRATYERLRTLQRSELDGRRLRSEEQNRLAGELLELREVAQSLDRELALLREKEQQLIVRSDMRGQVVTWNVGTSLLRRPVQRGQLLMTVEDPQGDWELELYMPVRRMGHVQRAAANGTSLIVTFQLASHPERSFRGRVVEIHRSAEVHGDEGNTVRMQVAVDKSDLPELRSETSVTARVHCGRRGVGYVWLHDLIETIQSKVLFWV